MADATDSKLADADADTVAAGGADAAARGFSEVKAAAGDGSGAGTDGGDGDAGVSISLGLVREACFPGDAAAHDADEVLKERTLRLNNYRINAIDGLELMSHVTDLYLQNNLIRRIENLEVLSNLKFLVLAGNHITKVEGLLGLRKLEYVDLGRNAIEDLTAEELPTTLVGASFAGNPCALHEDYRIQLILRLPQLRFLDSVPIPFFERRVTHEVMGLEPPAPVEGVDDVGDEEFASFFDDSLALDDSVQAEVRRLKAELDAEDRRRNAADTSSGAGSGGATAAAAPAAPPAASGGVSRDRIRELMFSRQSELCAAEVAIAQTGATLHAAKAKLEAARERSRQRRAEDAERHREVSDRIAAEREATAVKAAADADAAADAAAGTTTTDAAAV